MKLNDITLHLLGIKYIIKKILFVNTTAIKCVSTINIIIITINIIFL